MRYKVPASLNGYMEPIPSPTPTNQLCVHLSMCKPERSSCAHCCQLVWPAWCLVTCVLFLLGNLSTLSFFPVASGVEDVEGYKYWNERLCSLLFRLWVPGEDLIFNNAILQNIFRLFSKNSFEFYCPVNVLNGYKGPFFHTNVLGFIS